MSTDLWQALLTATWETIIMVLVSGLVASIIGLPIGIYVFITRPNGIWPQAKINRICDVIVNAWRSIPFIILLVAIIPFTRLVVGSSIGTAAAIVPLIMAAIPFFARLVDVALQEIPKGLIEAGQAMGATPKQIVSRILLPEVLPSLINALTLTLITLVGYSAMAGTVGGGGLGDLAIQYGYQRFNVTVMLITVLVLIVFVQVLQSLGDWLVNRVNKGN